MEQEVNRAKTLWQNWEQIEKDLDQIGQMTRDHPLELARQKYDFLREGLYRLSDEPRLLEKPYLAMISAVCGKLQRKLYPNRFVRLLHQIKALVYDKPVVVSAHRLKLEQNLSDLKRTFRKRELDELTWKLDEPIDHEKQQLSWKVEGYLDRLRTVALSPVLEKDGLGFYQLAEIRAQCFSTDHSRLIDVVIPNEYHLNREQLVNLLQERAVFVSPDQLGPEQGKWLQLNVDAQKENSGMSVFEKLEDYDLKRGLEVLAADTGIYRITAAEVLAQLRLGNSCQILGKHSSDEPFLLQADPAAGGIKILDKSGNVISREELITQLRQEEPVLDKTLQNQLSLLKGKDQHTDIRPGLNL